MTKSMRSCLTTIILSAILGFVVFFLALFEFIILEVLTFPILFIMMIIGIGICITFVFGSMLAEKSRILKESYCCCGKMSVIGAVGIIITAMLTLLLFQLNFLVCIGIALSFFFLGLALGGIICFLTSYFHCYRNDCQ